MAMKDFNDLLSQDRQFKVQDQVFTWKDVRPEVLSSFEMNGADANNPNAVWELIDAQILLYLDEPDQERWKELRAREKEPVTIGQMNAILTWLTEEQTGRPTEQPAPSAPGRGRTAASSKAG